MKTMLRTIVVMLAVAPIVAFADRPVPNEPVVRASEDGRLYAKSVPYDMLGQKGKTQVFRVGREGDTLLCEYDWYARRIYLGGGRDPTLIRFGPRHGGHKPQDEDFAIGIYRNGKVIREYSTLQMQKMGSGVLATVSFYHVLKEGLGFRLFGRVPAQRRRVYEVKGVSGKVFAFDLQTGEIVQETTEPSAGGDAEDSAPQS
jgi:hypothetical protein